MGVRFGLWRKLSTEELMLLNCGVGELLRVPWTARRSNQSILKEISPGCSLEGLMLKLKLQYLGHLMLRSDSFLKRPWCWERLRAGGGGDDRGWDGWMASPTQSTWVWVNSRIWWWTGRPGVLQPMGSQRVGHDWVTELKPDWKIFKLCFLISQVSLRHPRMIIWARNLGKEIGFESLFFFKCDKSGFLN